MGWVAVDGDGPSEFVEGLRFQRLDKMKRDKDGLVVGSVSDPSHFDVDPDPGIHIWEKWIRIHLYVIVDPDPRIHIWKKWIRIRVPIFHKEIHVRHFSDNKNIKFYLLL